MRTTLEEGDKEPKIESAMTSRSPKEEVYREVNDLKKHIDVLEAEIERCNSEILKKNAELLELRNTSIAESEFETQLKVAEFEKQRLEELLKEKSIEVANLRS